MLVASSLIIGVFDSKVSNVKCQESPCFTNRVFKLMTIPNGLAAPAHIAARVNIVACRTEEYGKLDRNVLIR